ncbi:hypothetical protein [Paenarthrobacter sp. 22069]|uniref:hypothetical protein n=1 Tax=Paenarthrobacter sp. 22069 TaxID=3453864 RepID=UPI003F83D479
MLDAAFSAGSSVELLAKSLLASVSPVLLAASNNTDVWSLLRFAGATVPEGEMPSGAKVKSIDANQSIERLRYLRMIPIPWSQGDSAAVFEVRNAAAHMGLVDREALSSAMRLVVRFSEYARIRLDQGTDEWWRKNLGLVVEQLLDEGLSELQRGVQAKLASARLRYEEDWGARPPELVKPLLESVRYPRPEGSFSSMYRVCPVCGHLGLAYGYTSEEECLVELPHPDGGFWMNPYLGVTEFDCSSCRLHLVGDAELRAAGLDGQMGLASSEDDTSHNEHG